MDGIHGELLRGNIDTIVLKSLFDGDKYGYEICKDIEERTKGQYKIKQPTMYSCLARLETQGLVNFHWGESTKSGGRRKYFALTQEGRDFFSKKQREWEYSRTVVDKLISENIFDLSGLPPLPDEPHRPRKSTQAAAGDTDSESAAEASQLNESGNGGNQEASTEEQSRLLDELTAESADTRSDSEELSDLKKKYQEMAEARLAEKTESASALQAETATVAVPSTLKAQQTETDFFTREYGSAAVDPDGADALTSYSASLKHQTAPVIPPPKAKLELQEDSFFSLPDDSFQNDTVFTLDREYQAESFSPPPAYGQTISLPEPEDLTASYLKDTTVTKPIDSTVKSSYTFVPEAREAVREAPRSLGEKMQMKTDAREFMGKNNSDATTETFAQKEYKSILSKLISPSPAALATQKSNAPQKSADNSPVVYAKPTQNSVELYQQVSPNEQIFSDGIKIRHHSKTTSKEYNNMFYVLGNKLRLFQYLILAVLMLVETLATYVLLRYGLGITGDGYLYIIACVLSVLLPITALALYGYRPTQTKRIDNADGTALLYRFFITLQAVALVVCINILVDKNILMTPANLTRVILPSVLCLNFLFNSLIHIGLCKTKRFAL